MSNCIDCKCVNCTCENCTCDNCRRTVRTALFDYMQCKSIAMYEGWTEYE